MIWLRPFFCDLFLNSRKAAFYFYLAALISLSSCMPNINIPDPDAGECDFRSTVAIGGDFLAGYQDGALSGKGQKNSIPTLLGTRFQLMRGSDCLPPLIPDDKGLGVNSKPWESSFVTKSILGYKTDCEGNESLSPLKELFGISSASAYFNHVSGTVRNFSVPGATVKDLFNPSFGIAYGSANQNPFYSRFASQRGVSTVFSDLLALDPTFEVVWVGMEDIYEYARVGGDGKTIMPASEFSYYLDSILKPVSVRGGKGIIANIPELRYFPFFSLIPWNGLDLNEQQAHDLNEATGGYLGTFQVGKNGFVVHTSTEPMGFRMAKEGECILLTSPLDSMKCFFVGSKSDIPDRYVLDYAEKALVDYSVLEYNRVIAEKADQYGFALADMNSFFGKVFSGVRWDGVDYNATFVSGGFFSLDGYHPNQKGYEMITNEFIRTINRKYNSVVPTVYCSDCTGILFP